MFISILFPQSIKRAQGVEFYIWSEYWTAGPGWDVCVQLLSSYQDVREDGASAWRRNVSKIYTIKCQQFIDQESVLQFSGLCVLGPVEV